MKRLKQTWKVTALFMTMMLLITLGMMLLPEVTASPGPVKIDLITPSEGRVGETVGVNGQIDTQNGSYIIFFEEEEVKNGTAVDKVVNETFIVPHRPFGNYNVKLHDVAANTSDTATFALETAYYIQAVVPSPPKQLQEGNITKIWVNVTGGEANTVYFANITVEEPPPANLTYWTRTLISLTNTTTTGYGEGSRTYPTDFSAGAHTNYTGTYEIAFNKTDGTALKTGNFTVGLTDRLEYPREETVSIRGSGYRGGENVTVNITTAGLSVAGYPKNVTAEAGGVVIDSWAIPEDAKPGTHTVTLTNATSDGTVKTVADIQNFTVVGAVCLVRTWNLADPPEPVAKAIVEVSNATTNTLLETESTNETGWVEFWLELGNYTFEAFFMIGKNFVLVGNLLNQSMAETTTYKLNLTCQLSHIKITVRDETKNPLSFINVTLTSTYTARSNQTIPRIECFETNSTGTVTSFNTVANISYKIEARRYGHMFNRTLIENLTAPLWINITCPTYTMFINVLDSKDLPIQNADVDIIEWSSEIRVDRKTTNTLGSVAFSYTFGRYKVRVYNGSASLENTVVLNETVIDLIEDQFFLLIYCKIYKIDLSLSVIDYFGQPIPNAVIKVERDGVELESPPTGKDGTTLLLGIMGGDCRFSVYILGKLCETRALYLDRDKEIVFKIDTYIAVGGYPLEIVQFIALVSLSILVAIFALALAYRRIWIARIKKKEEESSAQQE